MSAATAELKPGFSVTQEHLTNFFTDVREATVVLMSVVLGDISLKELGMIDVKGIGTVKASEEACNSLMNIVGVKSLLRDNMQASGFGTDAYIALANTLRVASKDRQIGMVIDLKSSKITKFTSNSKAIMPSSMFVDRVSEMIGKNGMKVVHANLDEDGSISVIARPDHTLEVKGLKHEDYRLGIEATLTVDAGAQIAPFFERMVCLNGAIARRKTAGTFACTKQKDSAQFLRAVSDFRGFDNEMFEKRMKLFNSTQSSLFEIKSAVEKMSDAFVSGKKSEDPAWDLIATEIPIEHISKEITKRTGIKKPLSSMADSMLKQMRSPMTCWELFNAMTQVSTHIERRTGKSYSEKSRRYVSANAGAMLFEHTPDLYMPIEQIW
jgi:hypothetical protein